MPNQDIIVIGASAGGVEALQQIVSQLPSDLPAAVFVVMHMPALTRSWLPAILGRSASLPTAHAEDGEPIQHGRIYVAQPDCHLVIKRDHVHLSRGPREQHHRPAINVTLRTAALAYSSRVAGVILTGELDDGTAGQWEVKQRGGVVVVQNPEEAAFPSMPLSVLREVEADYVLNLAKMGEVVSNLASGKGKAKRTEIEGNDVEPKLTDLTCPECRGTIWELARGVAKEYRCRVGHTYSVKSMLAEHFATQEKALYAAVVALEEGASLVARLADQIETDTSQRLKGEARELQKQAETVRGVLSKRRTFSLD